ncbi:MAG: transposase [Patescibacteria group bacterium]
MKNEIIGRTIGIRHRVKRTADGEASPTLICIREGEKEQSHELDTEQEEMDFLLGRCPIKYRACTPEEDISTFPVHHVQWRAAEQEDVGVLRHASQCRYAVGEILSEVASKVPSHYIGIKAGDTVAMVLGGSGDYFAFALSAKLSKMNGAVLRIPPVKLQTYRGEVKKDGDAVLLARLASSHTDDFYPTEIRDRRVIIIRCQYQDWVTAMQARIACEQRLWARHIGLTFCSEEGGFPEGTLQKEFEARKANDPILQNLQLEEARADKALKKAVEALDVWKEVFDGIPGIGHRIAARLIHSVIDIRRFPTETKLCAYLGVHVLKDGKFPRRRKGGTSNWQPEGRQALYLLAEQLVRQKDRTAWGAYFLKRKAALRDIHPVEVLDTGTGKKRYTKGHIHKMAIWRTLTRFTEFLYREWKKVEESAVKKVEETDKAA